MIYNTCTSLFSCKPFSENRPKNQNLLKKKGHEAKYEPSEWEIIFTKYIIALLGSLEMLNSVKVLRLLHILP